MYDNTSRVIEVDIDEILPNRFQPRIQFDEEEILELSDSIKEHGVIQPIVVRTIGDKYEIIAGERRYKASVLAGKETVPVIIKNLNDRDSAEIALIENVQRKNLTPIEEALSYKKILDMGYITQENLAVKLGKSQSSIANKIRLLNLSDEVQEALLENKISERHARSLLKLETSKMQNEMLNRIITERLTVRRTDEEIEKLKQNSESQDEGNGDSQKIVEKGERDMNNNEIFGIPNVPQTPQPPAQDFNIFAPAEPTQIAPQSFDIFGAGNQTMEASAAPVVETPVVNEIPQTSFDTLQSNNVSVENTFSQPFIISPAKAEQSTPVAEVPVAPVTPAVEQAPTMPVMEGVSVDVSGNVEAVPTIAATPVTPAVEQAPTMGFGMGDSITNITEAPVENGIPQTQPIVEEVPAAPVVETPIDFSQSQMTQQSEDLFSFGNATEEPNTQQNIQPEFKMPEPIIVTDYSKQYDPVMPQAEEFAAPKVEFKEVINAIRECSNKIEQFGFKIDVEEYDLANLYQVVFKVEK